MEARELRIGNLLYYQGTEDVCEVYIIGEDTFECKTDLGKMNQGVYEPIPLTEEWFLKLGFRKITSIDESHNLIVTERYPAFERKGIIVATGDNDCGWWAKHHNMTNGVICMKYVHKLQNLYFAFYGEELEYKR